MLKSLIFSTIALLAVCQALQTCEECLNSGNHYCADTKMCNSPVCLNSITHILNCPRAPNVTYDDNEARTKWLPLFGASATSAQMAQKCFESVLTFQFLC
eukprot:NP_001294345.1 Uncharacterized protein CELE_K03H6.2 [Caenorhabditis elegans]